MSPLLKAKLEGKEKGILFTINGLLGNLATSNLATSGSGQCGLRASDLGMGLGV